MRIWMGLACSALVLAATPALATAYMFKYGWTTPGQGQPVGTYASGSILTDGPGFYDADSENVASMSGTRMATDPIAGGSVSTVSFDDSGSADQELYPADALAHVDSSGLSFDAGGRRYTISSNGGGSGSTGLYTEYSYNLIGDPDGRSYQISFFNLMPQDAASDVPEVASWAMMVMGLGAVGFSLRRRAPHSVVIVFNR